MAMVLLLFYLRLKMNFIVSKNGPGTKIIWTRKYKNMLMKGTARKINLFFFKPKNRLIPVMTSRPINIYKIQSSIPAKNANLTKSLENLI